jgi:hypothetical protein
VKLDVIFAGTDGEWRELASWANKSQAQRDGEMAEAWTAWVIASCAERTGGHRWWLDWDTEDGLDLCCLHCPAGVDELYPDGNDLIFAELPVVGYRGQCGAVKIDYGSVSLSEDPLVSEWHGPVRAWVHEESYYSWEYGAREYDAWVIIEAA